MRALVKVRAAVLPRLPGSRADRAVPLHTVSVYFPVPKCMLLDKRGRIFSWTALARALSARAPRSRFGMANTL